MPNNTKAVRHSGHGGPWSPERPGPSPRSPAQEHVCTTLGTGGLLSALGACSLSLKLSAYVQRSTFCPSELDALVHVTCCLTQTHLCPWVPVLLSQPVPLWQ